MATQQKQRKRAALYARVSTTDQTTTNQLRELRAVAKRAGWKIVGEFIDRGISGAKGRDQRPEFNRLHNAVTRREVDIILAWSVDRLGRSLLDVLKLFNELRAAKVDIYLHQQAVDTTTPAGKMLFQMCGVFAEFEREMIRERVKAGLARARERLQAEGKTLGRPFKHGPVDEGAILKALKKGVGKKKIARQLRIGVSVVQRVAAAAPI